jgi:ribose/xylose/arabinose/galactoside ABC-type transport system permease subunit
MIGTSIRTPRSLDSVWPACPAALAQVKTPSMASTASTARRLVRFASLYLGLLALFLYGALTTDQFLSLDNQRDVLWQVSNNGVIAIGMTLVILTGGIDLSVGSLLSVGSVVCAMLLMERGWHAAAVTAVPSLALVAGLLAGMIVSGLRGVPVRESSPEAKSTIPGLLVGAVAAAVVFFLLSKRVPHGFGTLGVLALVPAFGLLLGIVSGVVIARGNLQPFIVTLAMMVSAVGLAKLIAGAGGRIHAIYVDPGSANSAPETFFNLASNLRILGREILPVPGIFFAVTALLAWLLLRQTRVGRYIYAVGGNEEAGRYSGLNTGRVKILVYAISGMLSALAAVLYCAQYQQGKADAGLTRELDAIAAVVIGGTSLMGGRGGIGGTIVGVFIFGYLKNILNLRGVATEFQQILQGVIIILAVLLQEGVLVRWVGNIYRTRIRQPAGVPSGFPIKELES